MMRILPMLVLALTTTATAQNAPNTGQVTVGSLVYQHRTLPRTNLWKVANATCKYLMPSGSWRLPNGEDLVTLIYKDQKPFFHLPASAAYGSQTLAWINDENPDFIGTDRIASVDAALTVTGVALSTLKLKTSPDISGELDSGIPVVCVRTFKRERRQAGTH